MKQKEYPLLLDPSGSSFIITNARKFAKEHKLDPSSLSKVLNGKQTTHKGWKLA